VKIPPKKIVQRKMPGKKFVQPLRQRKKIRASKQQSVNTPPPPLFHPLRKSMFNNRFRTTFLVTPTPRKNVYKPSLYDICLEYSIKDVKFIFIYFLKQVNKSKNFPAKTYGCQ
jgi:hypothetical protein